MLDRTDLEPLFFAPFVSSVMCVEPGWIDYNGHLNMAYYNVLFDRCVDEAYELLGLHDAPGTRTPLGDEAPFVGREVELGQVAGRLAEVIDRKEPRVLVFTAEAGIGLTRFASEVARYAAGDAGRERAKRHPVEEPWPKRHPERQRSDDVERAQDGSRDPPQREEVHDRDHARVMEEAARKVRPYGEDAEPERQAEVREAEIQQRQAGRREQRAPGVVAGGIGSHGRRDSRSYASGACRHTPSRGE